MNCNFKLTSEANSDLFYIWRYLYLEAGIEVADKIKNNIYNPKSKPVEIIRFLRWSRDISNIMYDE